MPHNFNKLRGGKRHMWKGKAGEAKLANCAQLNQITATVTALRFVATRRSARKPGLEDWLAAAATLFFTLTDLAGLMAISILNGREIAQEIAESPSDYKRMRQVGLSLFSGKTTTVQMLPLFSLCFDNILTAKQWDMAGLYSYFAHALTVKLSVLALYYRIFGVNRAYRIWIYLLGAFQTVLFIIFCIFQGLHCKPFERYFDRSIPGSCKNDGLVILGGETPNSLVDFAMVALAMFMIRRLQLSTTMKWRLRFLFGLGALVGVLGFIKIAITYSTDDLYAFSMLSILSCVQMFISILCCCLPVFRPILPTAAFWSRLSSRMISYATFGRVSRNRTTAYSGKRSSKCSGLDSAGKHHQGWKHLGEDNSTKGLAWPEATHEAEAHALSDLPVQGAHPESPGIQVLRRFDVV
ncbi:hypothetical protein DL765_000015 [Monosporascus sp. GIB2]|nr:hypothetical protein DL765_000015 [Monosporascus sp. GIB2]